MTRSLGGRHLRRWAAMGCAVLLLGGLASPGVAAPRAANAQGFDFDTDNAALLLFMTAGQQEQKYISSTGSEVPIIVYYGDFFGTALFDAIAPYHPTAVGVFSNLGRRPESEATNRNKNIAILYAGYRILDDFMPQANAHWRDMLTSVGLDPDDDQENLESPVGLGNLAARKVLERREGDAMNRRGGVGGVVYNRAPYADHTGYEPVNTAYELRDPSRWQPDVVSNGRGTFEVQQFLTPQMGLVEAFTFKDASKFQIPPPKDSDHRRARAYRRQADEVLAASAALTDRQKMMAEFFNDKALSLGNIATVAGLVSGELDVEQFIHYLTTTDFAIFDTAVAVWHQKRHFDSVRPFSAIRYLYEDEPVTAWGGPGRGTVDDIPGGQWRSYLQTPDHPEYPSGSAALCLAFAEAARLFLGTDEIEIAVDRPAGSSLIEPGVTPARDITLSWDTWTQFAADCGMSRFWAGVHFLPSIENMADFAPQFGQRAYEFVQRHINGDV